MNAREIYAWCLVLSLSGIAWIVAGWTGPLIFWAGLYVGPADLGWIDDIFDEEKNKSAEEPLPSNVTVLPVKRRKVMN